MKFKYISIVASVYLFALTSKAKTIYVDDNASAGGDGTSWSSAHKYLQDALASAEYGDEIWVAEGTYKPDQGAGISKGDRTASFKLNGIFLYGAFNGSETTNNPNGSNEKTILSGEIDNNSTQWSLHVVSIDGKYLCGIKNVTITKGNANGDAEWNYDKGGGVYWDGSLRDESGIFINCIFEKNSAVSLGGGFYGSLATFFNCKFTHNNADWGGGGARVNEGKFVNCTFFDNRTQIWGAGGGATAGDGNFINCRFANNSADSGGGASFTNGNFINCIFDRNSANSRGGGVSIGRGSSYLTNCIFTDNSSKGDGGAVDLIAENETTFSNCTFVNNVAKSYGGAVSNSGSWVYYDKPLVRLKNCILWNNYSQGIESHGFEPSLEPTKITLQEEVMSQYPGDPNAQEAIYSYKYYNNIFQWQTIHQFTFNGVSYEVIKVGATWADAAEIAVSRNGKLVEIESVEEQNAIFSAIGSAGLNASDTVAADGGGGAYLWIGGNDIAVEGNWVWDGDNDLINVSFWTGEFDGTAVGNSYVNWGSLIGFQFEPDDFLNEQDALAISLDGWMGGSAGQWNDVDQSNLLFSIVEYDSVIPLIDNQGWTENENAFSADPLFVNIDDPIGPDGIWLTADDGLRLKSGSPAIDAGIDSDLSTDSADLDNDDNTTESIPSDIAGYRRIQGRTVDLGAYEHSDDELISATPQYSISAIASTDGTVSGGGTFDEDASVTLTATPSNSGYIFSGWSGDASGTTNPLTITADSNKSITANFSKDNGDDDGDGITNFDEIVTYETSKSSNDTDGDGLTDKEEIERGLNPKSSDKATIDAVMELKAIRADNVTPMVTGWYYVPNHGWFWTSKDVYPYTYCATDKDWMYFQSGNNKPKFYRYKTKTWLTVE